MFNRDHERYSNLISSRQPDFFDLLDYQVLEAKRLGGSFVYFESAQNESVVVPFIERSFYTAGKAFKDLTMAYGYPAPMYTAERATLGESLEFVNELINSAREAGYVSGFLRSNPMKYRGGATPCTGADLHEEEKVVRLVSLLDGPGTLDLGMRKSHRREIKKAREIGISIEVGPLDSSGLREFMLLYKETMNKVGALKEYYFETDYIRRVSLVRGGDLLLGRAFKDNRCVAASLLLVCGTHASYYLSASDGSRFTGYATKALIRELAICGMSMGATALNLGGGLGGRRDSLYEFKKGFGGEDSNLYLKKLVFDEEGYEFACQHAPSSISGSSTHFPAYRARI